MLSLAHVTRHGLRPSLPALVVILVTLGACAAAPDDLPVVAYCYQTLADVACYLAPDVGREGTFTGRPNTPACPTGRTCTSQARPRSETGKA